MAQWQSAYPARADAQHCKKRDNPDGVLATPNALLDFLDFILILISLTVQGRGPLLIGTVGLDS